MTSVIAAPREHYGWLLERTDYVPPSDFRAIEAVDSTGKILGMVGYDHWTPNSIQAHMAVDSPIAWRHLLRPAFEYPFEQVGKGVMIGVILSDNPKGLAMARTLGLQETHRILDGHSVGVDLVVFEMRREHCKWLKWPEGRRAA